MARLDKFLYRVEQAACLFFCVLMIVIVTAEVACRYCLGTTLMVGVQEFAMWSFIWMVTMACAALVHQKKHIAVEYFLQTFCPPGIQDIVYLLTEVFLIFFFVAVIITGFPFAFGQWGMRTTSANIPKTIPFLAVPVAISFMLVHSSLQIGRVLRKLFSSGAASEE